MGESADPVTLLADALASSGAGGLGSADEIAANLRGGASALAVQLEAGLIGRPTGARWLLCVDGLERLFLKAYEAHRLAFLDLLKQALSLPRLRVVATLRADFLADCIEFRLMRRSV